MPAELLDGQDRHKLLQVSRSVKGVSGLIGAGDRRRQGWGSYICNPCNLLTFSEGVIKRENGARITLTKQWQGGPASRGLGCAMLAAPVRSTLGQSLASVVRHHHNARSDSCIAHVVQWCQRCSLQAPELY